MKNLKFKRILTTGTLCLLTAATHLGAQISVETSSNVTTEVTGALEISLDGNWTNNGTLVPGSSTILLNGSGAQTIVNPNGNFHHLTLNKSGGDAQAGGSFTVDGMLSLTDGGLDLNGKVVTLGANALLSETDGNTVKGTSGHIETTRTLGVLTNENVAGLGFEITTAVSLGQTQIIRGHAAQTGNGNESVLRYFDISPATNSGLDATVAFRYDDSEINGNTEADLRLFRSPDAGTNWENFNGSADDSANTVTQSNIDQFSRWTVSSFCLETINHVTADAGADVSVLAGAEIQIGGAPTGSQGTGTLTYAWTPVDGLDDPTAENPIAEPAATTTYTVTVTDENGCESTDDVIVTVTSFADHIAAQCAAIQTMIDDPGTPEDAIEFLEDAQTACAEAQQAAIDGETEDLFDAMRDVADALEEARDENADTDAIATEFADLAKHIAAEKKEEALVCDPTPSGKMADDIEDGDKDFDAGNEEYDDGYFGDAIKDYSKAWENYCSALDRCESAAKVARVTDEFGIEAIPESFALYQNYPNPFNPTTTIRFDLPETHDVRIDIFNSAGQHVRTLVNNDYSAGAYKIVWDARDDRGLRVASGMYLYTIRAGQDFRANRKLLLMK